jgi:heat shock protein 5
LTITNDKGRLTKEQIEKMIKDADKYAEHDNRIRERIDAKKMLEDYIASMKNTINDGLASKLSKSDVATIEDNVRDQQDWMESNEEADKEDYEYHLKELQEICNPIISKVYKTKGSHGGHGGDDDIDGDL